LLIQQMIRKALSFNDERCKIGIVLSHSQDNDKNPLSCEEKRILLMTQGMIDALKNRIKAESPDDASIQNKLDTMQSYIFCKNDDEVQRERGQFPIQSINALLTAYGYPQQNPNTKLHLMVGQDRASSYDWLIPIFHSYNPSVELVIEALPRPEGAMSATQMRNLVKEGNRGEFIDKMREAGLDEEMGERLFVQLDQVFSAATATKTKRQRKKGGRRSTSTSTFRKSGVKSTFRKSGVKTKARHQRKTRKNKRHMRR